MSHPSAHESVYDGLLVNDAHWAFGTDFEDPLAGVDTSVPDGLDPGALATYCLMLGDDALVMAQRLAEWCSRAPDLEEDVALANIALDLLGQARLLLTRAAAADPAVVPRLPAGSPVPPEDALAFFRDAHEFRSLQLAELPNGDFARTITRLLVFAAHRLATFRHLLGHRDTVLAAVAAKGVKELTYHRDAAGRWFLTLAQGTEESRRRVLEAVQALRPWWAELAAPHPTESLVGPPPGAVLAELDDVLGSLFEASEVDWPGAPPTEMDEPPQPGVSGREGVHTEHLVALLAELQEVARAHPMGRW